MYRKKPVVIEARLFDPEEDYDEATDITRWCGGLATEDGCDIKTFEGVMRADFGDYIIKGIQGEFYPCKPDIFEETYDEVKE